MMTDTPGTHSKEDKGLGVLCLEVLPLLIGVGLLLMGVGLQGTLVGVRANLEDFSMSVTGIIMAAYYAGFLGGAWYVPRLIRSVGHVRTFAALGAISSATALLYVVLIDPYFWILLRVILGFCFSGLYVVVESWLNDRSPNKLRGQILSIYIVVNMGGLTAGQYLLLAADPQTMTLFVLISVLVSIAVVPCTLSSGPVPDVKENESMPFGEVAVTSPIGTYVVATNGLISGTIFGIGAVYAREIGMSYSEISSFIAAFVVGGAVLQWPIGWLSDRVNRRGLIIVLSIAGAIAALLVGFASGSGSSLYIFAAMGMAGGVIMPMYSLGVSLVNDRLSSNKMVAASSSLVFVYGFGAAAGPLAGSFLMETFGPASLFFGLAGVAATTLLVAGLRIGVTGAPDFDAHRSYRYIPPRGSIIAQVTTATESAENGDEQFSHSPIDGRT